MLQGQNMGSLRYANHKESTYNTTFPPLFFLATTFNVSNYVVPIINITYIYRLQQKHESNLFSLKPLPDPISNVTCQTCKRLNTHSLIELCHLWVIPAGGLGLVTVRYETHGCYYIYIYI